MLTSYRLLALVLSLAIANVAAAATLSPSLQTNLAFWLDASNTNGNGTSTPGALSSWTNIAPGGNNRGVTAAAQNTVADQPTVQAGALNGLPVVQFNGSTDVMLTQPFSTPISQPDQIFIVWKVNAIGPLGDYAFDGLNLGNSGNRQVTSYELINDNGFKTAIETNAGSAPTTAYGPNTSFSKAVEETINFAPNASGFSINGTTQTSGQDEGPGALDGVTLGQRFTAFNGDPLALNGYIAEMLIFTTPLNSTDTKTVETYLYDKWLTPEPSSFVLGGIGAVVLAAMKVRRRRS